MPTHKLLKAPQKKHIVKCDECDYEGYKSEELLKHKITIHVWYNCDQCHNKFDSPANLSIHMQVEHTIEDIIQTGVGFMMRRNSTAQTDTEPQLQPLPEPQLKPRSKSQHQIEPVNNQTNKKSRKSRKEHLKAKVKVKTLSKKAM